MGCRLFPNIALDCRRRARAPPRLLCSPRPEHCIDQPSLSARLIQRRPHRQAAEAVFWREKAKGEGAPFIRAGPVNRPHHNWHQPTANPAPRKWATISPAAAREGHRNRKGCREVSIRWAGAVFSWCYLRDVWCCLCGDCGEVPSNRRPSTFAWAALSNQLPAAPSPQL